MISKIPPLQTNCTCAIRWYLFVSQAVGSRCSAHDWTLRVFRARSWHQGGSPRLSSRNCRALMPMNQLLPPQRLGSRGSTPAAYSGGHGMANSIKEIILTKWGPKAKAPPLLTRKGQELSETKFRPLLLSGSLNDGRFWVAGRRILAKNGGKSMKAAPLLIITSFATFRNSGSAALLTPLVWWRKRSGNNSFEKV